MNRGNDTWWRTVLVAATLAAVTLAAYWPVLQNGFVVYDDHEYVTENPPVAGGLSWANVGWAFRTGHASNWHPLTWLSHELDCQLYGLKPAGHHLTSLLIHIANTILLFLVLRRMSGMQNEEGRMKKGEGGRGSEEGRRQNEEGRREGGDSRAPIANSQAPGSGATDYGPRTTDHGLVPTRKSAIVNRKCGSGVWRCAFVAGLFALHPLHVESVAWVAERKDVLSGLFFMLTLWAYTRYAEVPSPKSQVQSQEATGRDTQHATRNTQLASILHLPSSIFYLLSLTFFALGLMSKPMLVTVPFVLLLLDYWPLGRLTDHGPRTTNHGPRTARKSHIVNRILAEKLPFLALSVVSCVVTVLAQQGAMQPLANVPFAARVSNALVAYARYLGKTFWPVDLATPYPYPSHWPLGWVLAAGALLAGVTVAVVVLGRERGERGTSNIQPPASTLNPLLVGWLWYLGMLVPVIGLVQVGEQSMADRYTYLPLIGIFILVAWGAGAFAACGLPTAPAREDRKIEDRKMKGSSIFLSSVRFPRQSARRAVLSVVGVVVLLACAARTRDQLQWWRNSESLFQHAVAVSAKNFFAYYSLGLALDNQGRLDEALTNYLKAVELQPNYPEPLNNIGCILAGRKQCARAVPYFERALRSNPHWSDAHNNLAHCLCELGRFAEAIPHFEAVLKANPADRVALRSLAEAERRTTDEHR